MKCKYKASITAGTIFQDTSKPLKVWFRAMWYVTNQKQGVKRILDASAKNLNEAIKDSVEPNSIIRTDDWNGYNQLVIVMM